MTYYEKLKDPRWRIRRKQIIDRDNNRCVLCNNDCNRPHVHHINYKGQPWEAEDKDLVTLCDRCHFLVHKNPSFLIKNLRRHVPIKDDSHRYGRPMKLGDIINDWFRIGGSNG